MSYAEQNHYDSLSKFQSLNEFNNHFEQAMIEIKKQFTKSEYIALNKLRKFASEIFGVAWCKLQRAVAGTHSDNTFGVSRATFDRMLRKAKKLNLITVINQARKNNWQKHNVYVFNKLDELNMPENEIVSNSHTIDVPDTKKNDGALTINLSELPKEKQVKDNNKQPVSIDTEKLDMEEQRAYIEKYATNEYQIETFKLIEAMPMSSAIKEQAHIISLRIGSDATISDFICAKTVLLNMSVSSVDGLLFTNVVAAFAKAYEQARNRSNTPHKAKESEVCTERQIPFYNWLKERSHTSGRAVRNWIIES